MAATARAELRAGLRDHSPNGSFVHSRWTRQPRSSLLLPHNSVPSVSSSGLLRTGPTWPAGRRRTRVQVLPLSGDNRTMPHQLSGLGPTL